MLSQFHSFIYSLTETYIAASSAPHIAQLVETGRGDLNIK